MPNDFGTTRRRFLQSAAAASSLALLSDAKVSAETSQDAPKADFSNLKPFGDRLKPITPDEFRARMTRAQQLMSEMKPGFDALFFAPELRSTTSLAFAGV